MHRSTKGREFRMTIDEVAAAAKEAGLSYGQWVAQNRPNEQVHRKRKSKARDRRIKIDIDEVASLYLDGMSPSDIARKIKVTPSAVYVVIKTPGLKRLEAVE